MVFKFLGFGVNENYFQGLENLNFRLGKNFWKNHQILNNVLESIPRPISIILNPLSANPTKWLNTLKQFVGNLSMNSFSLTIL